MNISDNDKAELNMEKGAKAAWDVLKEQHQNEGPVQQVDLLRTTLNIKCKKGMPLSQMCCEIYDAVDQAFAALQSSTLSKTSPIFIPEFYETYMHQQRKKNIPQRTFVTSAWKSGPVWSFIKI